MQNVADLKLDQTAVASLKPGSTYKFLGACETSLQDEKRTLELAAEFHLQRMSVICSCLLSDVK